MRKKRGRTMKLYQLEYFCAVCEAGSITKAAEQTFVTQPAVSAAVHALENEYSVQLLIKDGKNARPTVEGKKFYQYARQMLKYADQFDTNIHTMVSGRGILRIGVARFSGVSAFTSYYSENQHKYSEMSFEITEAIPNVLLEGLRNEELDLIILPDHGIDKMEDLNDRTLYYTDMVYCVSKKDPLARKTSVKVDDIVDRKMVSFEDSYKDEYLKKLFVAAGFDDDPLVLYRFEQVSTMLEMIEAGLGTGFMPREGLRHYTGIAPLHIEGDTPVPVKLVVKNAAGARREVTDFVQGMTDFFLEKAFYH